MTQKFTLNDKINISKNRKVLVSELVGIQGEIFKYIKKGFDFDDEVLEKAGIKNTIRDEKVVTVLVEHEKIKEKVLPKETESLKNILKSLNTLDNQPIGDFDNNETQKNGEDSYENINYGSYDEDE